MPSRRFHSKTRSGCMRCKQRRVKCDGGLPKCDSCKRRGFVCKYADLDNARIVSVSTNKVHLGLLERYSAPSSSPLAACPAFEKIMHHYLTVVSPTVSTQSSIQRLWQLTFPSEATSRSYLWHGILSVSLLHRMHLHQESPAHAKPLALWHHSIALSSLRKCLNAPIGANSGAVFALSMCVGLFTFGIARTFPAEYMGPIDEILNQFLLIRGVQVVTMAGHEWLQASDFKIMTCLDDTEEDALAPDVLQAMNGLKLCNSESEDDDDTKITYELALQTLERRFRTTDSAYAKNPGFTMVWANVVPRAFMDLLLSRTPFALVILAHFCVLLHRVRHCWWIGNLGQEVVKEIGASVDAQWQTFLQWPRNKIETIHLA